MLRHPLIAMLLLFLIGGFSVGMQPVFWWYQLERSSFEQLWCENLDKPELECHGSCQISEMLQLRKADQTLGSPPQDIWPRSALSESIVPRCALIVVVLVNVHKTKTIFLPVLQLLQWHLWNDTAPPPDRLPC